MRLRILTYNMHKGFCFYSRQYVLHQLREAVRHVDADVVFLQEVLGFHPPNEADGIKLGTQFEFLADDIWSHFAYGKNAVYSDGHHGNAILSKFPILRSNNINVSTNRLEQRGLLHACIESPAGEEVHLVCLHLDLLERGRKQQMKRLIEHVSAEVPQTSSLIIAGDFNDWARKISDPLAEALLVQESGVMLTGKHALTFPSWRPILSLDRVYIRRFQVMEYRVLSGVPWSKMSDHAAVVVELEFLPR